MTGPPTGPTPRRRRGATPPPSCPKASALFALQYRSSVPTMLVQAHYAIPPTGNLTYSALVGKALIVRRTEVGRDAGLELRWRDIREQTVSGPGACIGLLLGRNRLS